MKKELYLVLALFIYPFIVLLPGVFTGFSTVDDGWMLLSNEYVTSLSVTNIQSIFTEPYHGQYSPLNTLYYALVYKLF